MSRSTFSRQYLSTVSGICQLGAGFLCALASASCGSTVVIDGSQPAEPSCEDPIVDLPQAQALELRVREPGTFVADRLHLRASFDETVDGVVDSEPAYLLAEIVDGAVYLTPAPADMAGPAELLQLGEDSYLRLHSPEQQLQVDIIDTSQPDSPTVLFRHALDGVAPAVSPHAAALKDAQLSFCYQHDQEAVSTLAMMDLSVPAQPGDLLIPQGANPCSFGFDGAAAHDSGWLFWIIGDDYYTPTVNTYTLSEGGMQNGVSFGYNPTGIHNYGTIRSAATNGTTAVINSDNDEWILFFPYDGFGSSNGPYHTFAFAGPKQLLTVTEDSAYFATPDGVHAYDISDPQHPTPSDYHAEVALDPLETHFVAANDSWLAITDQEGQLYLLPRQQSAKASPAPVFAGPAPSAPPAAPPCNP